MYTVRMYKCIWGSIGPLLDVPVKIISGTLPYNQPLLFFLHQSVSPNTYDADKYRLSSMKTMTFLSRYINIIGAFIHHLSEFQTVHFVAVIFMYSDLQFLN